VDKKQANSSSSEEEFSRDEGEMVGSLRKHVLKVASDPLRHAVLKARKKRVC
jgi:hypothetical protein